VREEIYGERKRDTVITKRELQRGERVEKGPERGDIRRGREGEREKKKRDTGRNSGIVDM
jgi:hypothetical protein